MTASGREGTLTFSQAGILVFLFLRVTSPASGGVSRVCYSDARRCVGPNHSASGIQSCACLLGDRDVDRSDGAHGRDPRLSEGRCLEVPLLAGREPHALGAGVR